MAKKVYYRQCSLRRGNTHTVSWLPEKFAEQGKYLKLKGKDGEWVDGWLVESVGSSRVEDSMLPDPHQSIKGHRKATGDSQPKNSAKATG